MPWGLEMNEPAKVGRRARKAIARAEKGVAHAERRFGAGDRLTLWARTHLASAYHEAGRSRVGYLNHGFLATAP
jgi:hypothetical protein